MATQIGWVLSKMAVSAPRGSQSQTLTVMSHQQYSSECQLHIA